MGVEGHRKEGVFVNHAHNQAVLKHRQDRAFRFSDSLRCLDNRIRNLSEDIDELYR